MIKNIIKSIILIATFAIFINSEAQTWINVQNTRALGSTPTCANKIRFYNSFNTLLATSTCVGNGGYFGIVCLTGRVDYITVDNCSGCTPFRVNMGVTSACGAGCCGTCNISVTTSQILNTPACSPSSARDEVYVSLD